MVETAPVPVSKNPKTLLAALVVVFLAVVAVIEGMGTFDTAEALWNNPQSSASVRVLGWILGHDNFVPGALLICLGGLVWLLYEIRKERSGLSAQPSPSPHVFRESERLVAMRRLLTEAASLASGKWRDLQHGDERLEEALGATWFLLEVIPEFLDRSFVFPKRREYGDFLKAEETKRGDDYRIENAASGYLSRLASRISDTDIDPHFLLPDSFEQFDPQAWPKPKYPHFEVRDRKEMYEEQKARRVTAAQWREMEARFRAVPQDIRADFHEWVPIDQSLTGRKTWRVCGGGAMKDAEALCAVAGAMLLRSPAVAGSLPDHVRAVAEDANRWLEFLRDRYRLEDHIYGVSTDGDVETGRSYGGRIEALGATSARACVECEAMEI